jgi:hypothetical protein
MNVHDACLAVALALVALVPACATASRSVEAPLTGPQVDGVYERFRGLEGEWQGTSTKGWSDTVSFQNIAGGSAVLSTSFAAHENETMVTLIHPDGERLLLTHYCSAKNQPRLQASLVNGNEVTFTFVDATNLPTRDTGHMDKVWIRFDDSRHFTERWTWYQDGKESWMEEIQYERLVAGGGGAR